MVEDLLAWPQTYDLDAVLLPALLLLSGHAERRSLPGVQRLREVCVAPLRARIARTPGAAPGLDAGQYPHLWLRPLHVARSIPGRSGATDVDLQGGRS